MRLILAALILAAAPALADIPARWRAEFPLTDFSRALVSPDEVFSGGPPRDGIPAIDAPRFETTAQALARQDGAAPVLSLSRGGAAKAWPLSVLIWHEIVNDRIGDVPVAVTFCPLCNSGVVFERVVGGSETSFGTTGRLRNSDLIMYDRASESWWQHYEGRAIFGAHAGETLTRLPARLETLAEFAARHPEGAVLTPPLVQRRDYGRNPYAGYEAAARPFLYKGDYDGPGRPLMRVVAVGDEAWSFPLLREVGVVETDAFTIRFTPGQRSALDAARIDESRAVGGVTVTDRQGRDVAHDVPFAFTFKAFRPNGVIRHAP